MPAEELDPAPPVGENSPDEESDKVLPTFSALECGTISIEKLAEKGEDSPPVVLHYAAGGSVGLVFDGMGGAGSQPATTPQGTNKTSAYWASHILLTSYIKQISRNNPGERPQPESSRQSFLWTSEGRVIEQNEKMKWPPICAEQKAEIDSLFKSLLTEQNVSLPHSKLRSKMIREFPTTIAVYWAQPSDSLLQINCHWAGDSRVYLLTCDGLQILTTDHVAGESDAYHSIKKDTILENCFSTDNSYEISESEFSSQFPCLIMACTDGVFNYFRNPWEFEIALIQDLCENETLDSFSSCFLNRISEISQDDATAAFSLYGDPELLKKSLRNRLANLRDQITSLDSSYDKIDKKKQDIASARDELVNLKSDLLEQEMATWESYRSNFEKHIKTQ